MNSVAHILGEAARLAGRGTPFILVTVVRADGSTPRNAGARMIWLPGDEIIGTIGGGELEHMVREHARTHFDAQSSGTQEIVLKADAEQCCGGVMEVLFEHVGPRARLVVFGAGHVSAALVGVLADAGLEVIVVDPRAEWANEERFPRCRVVASFERGIDAVHEAPERTLACVMTCSHDDDYMIVKSLLSRAPAFVGLIGSKSKWACFERQMRVEGVGEELVARVHCPIGLGDMGKEPGLVAVSIAGQVLLEAKKIASA